MKPGGPDLSGEERARPEAVAEAEDASTERPIRASARRLNALVENGESERFEEAFAHHLERDVTRRTWDDIRRGVDILVGTAILSEMTWAAQARAEDLGPDFDEEGLSPASQALIITVIIRYGGALLDAYYMSPGPHSGHDWTYIRPEPERDSRGDYRITTTVRKKNREELMVRGSSDSYLRWTSVMLTGLLDVGDREAFSARERGRFAKLAREAIALFEGEDEGA